jgi:nitroimidazol reductase NimA-like FMN-containing flavoprotein (pyridoxamine 5'-phosphate oxidase superfamily)
MPANSIRANNNAAPAEKQIRAAFCLIDFRFGGLIAMPIRWMSDKDAYEFLSAGTVGRLATCDRAGQPYVISLNYVYRDGRIYFHSKLTGRKLDNLVENNRVCFEVSEAIKITSPDALPCACATRYVSVLAFGTARILADNTEKATALNLLVEKYEAGRPYAAVDEHHAAGCAVVEICIDRISGKRNVDPEELAQEPTSPEK